MEPLAPFFRMDDPLFGTFGFFFHGCVFLWGAPLCFRFCQLRDHTLRRHSSKLGWYSWPGPLHPEPISLLNRNRAGVSLGQTHCWTLTKFLKNSLDKLAACFPILSTVSSASMHDTAQGTMLERAASSLPSWGTATCGNPRL